MRRYLTLAVVLALCSAPLSAELKDVPDSVFDMPAGFKEIPMPVPNIR